MPALLPRRVMQVIWPAFLAACVGELVFFSIFDPLELHFFGHPRDWSREGIYAVGFFCFWALGAASSALSLFLAETDRAAAESAENRNPEFES